MQTGTGSGIAGVPPARAEASQDVFGNISRSDVRSATMRFSRLLSYSSSRNRFISEHQTGVFLLPIEIRRLRDPAFRQIYATGTPSFTTNALRPSVNRDALMSSLSPGPAETQAKTLTSLGGISREQTTSAG